LGLGVSRSMLRLLGTAASRRLYRAALPTPGGFHGDEQPAQNWSGQASVCSPELATRLDALATSARSVDEPLQGVHGVSHAGHRDLALRDCSETLWSKW